MLCVKIIFTAQYSNILLLFHILVLLFNLHTESKILTFLNAKEKPDMLNRKVLNKKLCNKNIFYLNGKIYMMKTFLTEYKFILIE